MSPLKKALVLVVLCSFMAARAFATERAMPAAATSASETATLAAGCFWGTEELFRKVPGVLETRVGYTGGHLKNPTYEDTSTGTTGHAESVEIKFDPTKVQYEQLLTLFFKMHDPTTLNRQGHDIGTQYRSAIYYHSPQQKATAEQTIRELGEARRFANPIVTEVAPLTAFYKAEPYHQEYFAHNPFQPYCQAVVGPKVAKFRKQYGERLKKTAAT